MCLGGRLRATSLVPEYAWFLLPIVGLLWQLGGTFNRWYRRAGVPCTIFIFSLLYGISWQSSLLSSILLYTVTTLPFTIRKDGEIKGWTSWAWMWVLGALYGLPSQVLRLSPVAVIVPCIVVGTFGTLSNLRGTSQLAPWKMCEFFFGVSVAYGFCLSF